MNFREALQKATVPSPLLEGREKLAVGDILNEEIHLKAYDVIEGNRSSYVVMIIEEYPENYVNGGSVITDKLYRAAEMAGGLDAANRSLDKEPLLVKLVTRQSKTKGTNGLNNYYTDLEVL